MDWIVFDSCEVQPVLYKRLFRCSYCDSTDVHNLSTIAHTFGRLTPMETQPSPPSPTDSTQLILKSKLYKYTDVF